MGNKKLEIQEILSLGYLFLIVLGILHNAITFYFVDINYMEYTSVLDVLISPIAILTSSYKYLISIPLMIILLFVFVYFQKRYYKWAIAKKKYKSEKHLEKIEKGLETARSQGFKIVMSCFMLIGFYVGIGLKKGEELSTEIKTNKIKVNATIEFQDNSKEDIYLFHKNTLYAFYLKPNDKQIYIAPMDGNVMHIIKK